MWFLRQGSVNSSKLGKAKQHKVIEHRRLGAIRPSFFMPSDIQSPMGYFFLFSRIADIECPVSFPGFPCFSAAKISGGGQNPSKIKGFHVAEADIQCPVWNPILGIRWQCQLGSGQPKSETYCKSRPFPGVGMRNLSDDSQEPSTGIAG